MKKRFLTFFLLTLFIISFSLAVNTQAAPVREQQLIEEKWQALEKNEKNEIYELIQKCADNEIQLLKKLAELGVINAEASESIIKQMQKDITYIRENDQLPGILCHPHVPKEKRN